MENKINEKPKLSKEIARGSFFFGLAGFQEQFLGLLLSLIVVRVLNESEYGFYEQINSIYAIAISISFSTSFRNIVIKNIGLHIDNKQKIKSIISTHFFYSILTIIGMISFFSFCYIFQVVFEERLLLSLLIISTNSLLTISEIIILFVGLKMFKMYNIFKIIISYIHFALVLTFLIIFKYQVLIPGYYGIFWGLSIYGLIVSILSLLFVLKYFGPFWTKELLFHQIIGDSIKYGLISIVSGLFFNIDMLMIGSIVNDPVIADPIIAHFVNIQKTGMNISRLIPLLLGNMLIAVLTPLLSKDKNQDAEKIIGIIDKFLYYVLSNIMILVIFAAEEVIFLLYGPIYVVDSPYLFVSFIIIYFNIFNVSIDATFIILNKLRYLFYIGVLRFIILITLAYPLMSLFNPFIGMLIDLSISLVVAIIYMTYLSYRILKINFWKYLKKMVTIGTVIIILCVFIKNFNDFNLIMKIILISGTIVLYNFIMVITGAINRQDIITLKNIIEGEKFSKYIKPILRVLDKIPFKN